MATLSADAGKISRVRRWFVRHLLATIATTFVLGTFAWKNQYRESYATGDLGWLDQLGNYGWPLTCVSRDDFTGADHECKISVSSWPSLLLDASLAIAAVVATWVVFRRTQRQCERSWQISLASLLALMLLAGAISAIVASGWRADDPSSASGGSQPDS